MKSDKILGIIMITIGGLTLLLTLNRIWVAQILGEIDPNALREAFGPITTYGPIAGGVGVFVGILILAFSSKGKNNTERS